MSIFCFIMHTLLIVCALLLVKTDCSRLRCRCRRSPLLNVSDILGHWAMHVVQLGIALEQRWKSRADSLLRVTLSRLSEIHGRTVVQSLRIHSGHCQHHVGSLRQYEGDFQHHDKTLRLHLSTWTRWMRRQSNSCKPCECIPYDRSIGFLKLCSV